MKRLLNLKTAKLWHPESSGVKVVVVRSWVGRLFKPTCFATIGETLKSGIIWEDLPLKKINDLAIEFERAIPYLDIEYDFHKYLCALCKDVKESVNEVLVGE